MPSSQFISVRETAQLLAVSEKKVLDLIADRKLQAYRIADKFIRLKREEALRLRNSGQITGENKSLPYTAGEKIKDFIYFNDFYLISAAIIVILLYFILNE